MLGGDMVILNNGLASCELYHAKEHISDASETPKITLQLTYGPEFFLRDARTVRAHVQIIFRINLETIALPTATEPHKMAHTIVHTSARTYPNRPISCTAAQDITSGRIGQARKHTT